MRTWKVRLLALTSAVAMLLALSAPAAMADDGRFGRDGGRGNDAFNNNGFLVNNFDDDNDCDFHDCGHHRGFDRNFLDNNFFLDDDFFDDDNNEDDVDFERVGPCIAVTEGDSLDKLLCPIIGLDGQIKRWQRF